MDYNYFAMIDAAGLAGGCCYASGDLTRCRPSTVLTFITFDGTTTAAGYPLKVAGGTRLHLQSLLVFRYRADNELCSDAATATAGRRRRRRQLLDVAGGPPPPRRRRRQVTSVMSKDLVNTILADKDKSVGSLLFIDTNMLYIYLFK